jgi:hypothetical protein
MALVVSMMFAGVVRAQAVAPSVSLTVYSATVQGNIGSATAGVSVTVKLERDGLMVATAPTVSTDAAGDWSATLPGHAVSNAEDVIEVDYAGAGAPSNKGCR